MRLVSFLVVVIVVVVTSPLVSCKHKQKHRHHHHLRNVLHRHGNSSSKTHCIDKEHQCIVEHVQRKLHTQSHFNKKLNKGLKISNEKKFINEVLQAMLEDNANAFQDINDDDIRLSKDLIEMHKRDHYKHKAKQNNRSRVFEHAENLDNLLRDITLLLPSWRNHFKKSAVPDLPDDNPADATADIEVVDLTKQKDGVPQKDEVEVLDLRKAKNDVPNENSTSLNVTNANTTGDVETLNLVGNSTDSGNTTSDSNSITDSNSSKLDKNSGANETNSDIEIADNNATIELDYHIKQNNNSGEEIVEVQMQNNTDSNDTADIPVMELTNPDKNATNETTNTSVNAALPVDRKEEEKEQNNGNLPVGTIVGHDATNQSESDKVRKIVEAPHVGSVVHNDTTDVKNNSSSPPGDDNAKKIVVSKNNNNTPCCTQKEEKIVLTKNNNTLPCCTQSSEQKDDDDDDYITNHSECEVRGNKSTNCPDVVNSQLVQAGLLTPNITIVSSNASCCDKPGGQLKNMVIKVKDSENTKTDFKVHNNTVIQRFFHTQQSDVRGDKRNKLFPKDPLDAITRSINATINDQLNALESTWKEDFSAASAENPEGSNDDDLGTSPKKSERQNENAKSDQLLKKPSEESNDADDFLTKEFYKEFDQVVEKNTEKDAEVAVEKPTVEKHTKKPTNSNSEQQQSRYLTLLDNMRHKYRNNNTSETRNSTYRKQRVHHEKPTTRQFYGAFEQHAADTTPVNWDDYVTHAEENMQHFDPDYGYVEGDMTINANSAQQMSQHTAEVPPAATPQPVPYQPPPTYGGGVGHTPSTTTTTFTPTHVPSATLHTTTTPPTVPSPKKIPAWAQDIPEGEIKATRVCKPGPAKPPIAGKPNCLIIGDSISLGYSYSVAAALKDDCQVQLAPSSKAGVALDSSYGVQCLDSFLSTSELLPTYYDVVVFNFGLHDIDYLQKYPEEYNNLEKYRTNIRKIKKKLLATGATIAFALSTPVTFSREKDDMIKKYNHAAKKIMEEKPRVLTVNLHKLVTKRCGRAPYEMCYMMKKPHDVHYGITGSITLGKRIAFAIKYLLEKRKKLISEGDSAVSSKQMIDLSANFTTCAHAPGEMCPAHTTCMPNIVSRSGVACCSLRHGVDCGDSWHCCPKGTMCHPACSDLKCSCIK